MKSSVSKRPIVHGACALGILACQPARAQIAEPSLADAAQVNSVAARSKANYDPGGITAGSARIYAAVDARLTYDDNIFNTEIARRADGTVMVMPRVEARSQSPSHEVLLRADANIQRFARSRSQNNEQYNLAADGRLNIGRAASVTAGGFFGRRTELRGTLGDVVIGAPNQYVRSGGTADISVRLPNILIAVGGSVEALDYKPVSINGTQIAQDYRDRVAFSGESRGTFSVTPAMRLFAEGRYNVQRYHKRFNDQDSKGYFVIGGIDFGVTELISGELGIGYLSQTYNVAGHPKVGGITYNAKVVWNPTPLMTATLSGGRSLEQSPFFNQSGVIRDTVQLRLDYELLRNLIISLMTQGVIERYDGLDRRDRRYNADIDVRYLLNRTFEFGLRINHRHQSSVGLLSRRYTGTSATFSLIVKR